MAEIMIITPVFSALIALNLAMFVVYLVSFLTLRIILLIQRRVKTIKTIYTMPAIGIISSQGITIFSSKGSLFTKDTILSTPAIKPAS